MAYSIEQRAQMAAAIDKALGTSVATKLSDPLTDIVLEWMTAVVQKLSTTIAAIPPSAVSGSGTNQSPIGP